MPVFRTGKENFSEGNMNKFILFVYNIKIIGFCNKGLTKLEWYFCNVTNWSVPFS